MGSNSLMVNTENLDKLSQADKVSAHIVVHYFGNKSGVKCY